MSTGRSVNEVLRSKRILGVFQRVLEAQAPIATLLGFTGSNVNNVGGRQFHYDVFNATRTIATGRAPGDASALIKPQKVGEVQGTFPRSAESMILKYEDMMNRRRIGGPLMTLDSMGLQYITKQEMYMAQRYANLIEFQAVSMLKGSYTYTQSGDDLVHDYSGGGTTVDFQIPAGNKSQLDMLGGGAIINTSWATVASASIITDLFQINQAMLQLTGLHLQHVIMNSTTWKYILLNDEIQEVGGTSNIVFESLVKNPVTGNFRARLRAIPWVEFHIIDVGLEVGTSDTYTLSLADDQVFFIPEPSPMWCQYLNGSEVVVEGPNGPTSEQFGTYAFAYPRHDPAGYQLSSIHNGMPSLTVPAAVAFADVTP